MISKEIIEKVANRLEEEINSNFPLEESYECSNCDHEVYIMNEFERLPNLIKKIGIEEFIKWFTTYEIEIDSCSTCHYTLWFHGEFPEEEKIVKKWILDIIENTIKENK